MYNGGGKLVFKTDNVVSCELDSILGHMMSSVFPICVIQQSKSKETY